MAVSFLDVRILCGLGVQNNNEGKGCIVRITSCGSPCVGIMKLSNPSISLVMPYIYNTKNATFC